MLQKLQALLLARSDSTNPLSHCIQRPHEQSKTHPFLPRIPILTRDIPIHTRRHNLTHQRRSRLPQLPLDTEDREQQAE